MANKTLIGSYPAIGIRPVIDGRTGPMKLRDSLEDQTMALAEAAKALFEENLRYSDGSKVKVVIACLLYTSYSCRNGHENACENFDCLGVQSDGLGAEYFVIDKEYVYPIPEECPLDQACLLYPSRCV